MKKLILGMGVVGVVAAVAFVYRLDLMLVALKFASEREYEVAPNREIAWQTGTAGDSDTARPPNIVLIMLDDVGYNDISALGTGVANGRVTTPNIDALAQQSVVFSNGYAGNATCAPSRAMTMTGRYPTKTGFEFTPFPASSDLLANISNSLDSDRPRTLANASNNPVPFEKQGLPSSEVTIAELLADKGYHNVHIGKWHLGRRNGSSPNNQGFHESLLMHSGLFLPEDDPDVVNAKIDFDPIDKILWARLRYAASYNSASDHSDVFEPKGYLTDYFTDESVKVIKANKDRPFFLYLAHWGIHTPLQATRADYDAVGDIKPHRLRVYAAMMRSLDRSVQKIVAALKEEGLYDNTMIVFTNDNGAPGYVGLNELNTPYRGFKLSLFEGGIKVPYFVKQPNQLGAGQVIDTPVGHQDILPTMAAAAGVVVPDALDVDGINLLPMMASETINTQRPLFWQSGYLQAVRFGGYKLIRSQKYDQVFLFNMLTDPTEQVNLADSMADKVAQLGRLLDQHTEGHQSLYPYSLEAPIMIDKTLADKYVDGDIFMYWPN